MKTQIKSDYHHQLMSDNMTKQLLLKRVQPVSLNHGGSKYEPPFKHF